MLWVTKTTRPHNEDSWTIPLSMSATAEPLQHPDSLINTAASAEEAPATAAAPPSQTNSSVQATGGNSTVAASEGTAAGSSSSTGAAVSSTACQSEGCSSVTKTATWAAVYHPQQRPAADRSWGMISGDAWIDVHTGWLHKAATSGCICGVINSGLLDFVDCTGGWSRLLYVWVCCMRMLANQCHHMPLFLC